MFTRNKYVYTCPDVLHLQALAKRNRKIAFAINILFVLGMLVGGAIIDKKADKILEETLDDLDAED